MACHSCCSLFPVLDGKINIWHHDHEHPLQMTAFDFLQNQPIFFLFLFALQRLSNEQWGYLPGFHELRSTHELKGDYSVDLEGLNINKGALAALPVENDEKHDDDHSPGTLPVDQDEPHITQSTTLANEGLVTSAGYDGDVNEAQEVKPETPQSTDSVDLEHLQIGEDSVSGVIGNGAAQMDGRADSRITFKGKREDVLKPRFGLNGRGTGVLRGTVTANGKDVKVAIKLAYNEVTRDRESEILRRADETFGTKEWQDRFRARPSPGDPRDYLPTIVGEDQYPEFETSNIRNAVLSDEHLAAYQTAKSSRIPRVIVMPLYKPIASIIESTWLNFCTAFFLLFYCEPVFFSPLMYSFLTIDDRSCYALEHRCPSRRSQ